MSIEYYLILYQTNPQEGIMPEGRNWLIKDVAEHLGITKDAVLKIARGKLEVGEKITGMWWFSDEEVEQIAQNCRKYLLSQRTQVG